MHAIVAGVVSTWWFVPQEASSFCSQAIMGSAVRATTTSFGSICFGSLLVAILQTIRHLIQSARNDSDVDGCGAIMLCLAECLIRCFEEMLEYFNKFAYIYVGMVSTVMWHADTPNTLSWLKYFLHFYLLSFSMDIVILKQERMSLICSNRKAGQSLLTMI